MYCIQVQLFIVHFIGRFEEQKYIGGTQPFSRGRFPCDHRVFAAIPSGIQFGRQSPTLGLTLPLFCAFFTMWALLSVLASVASVARAQYLTGVGACFT